jgi:hypothetical protein
VRLWKAYHFETPGLRRARARGILLIFTAAAFALAPSAGDAWLGELGLSVHAAQSAAAPPIAAHGPPDKAAKTQASKPLPAPERKQPAIRAQMAELLQLASELQSDVDKTNKDMLSLTVVRKADEIEKLARSMKAERPVRSSSEY